MLKTILKTYSNIFIIALYNSLKKKKKNTQ